MITFVTDKDRNEKNDEEPVVGVTQTGTPVGKIVEQADKAAEKAAKEAKKADTEKATQETENVDAEKSNEKTDEPENVDAEKAAQETEKADAEEADAEKSNETDESENAEKSESSNLTEEKISDILNTFSIKENMALFHKGNLRNGTNLEYDGSIILLGDVNPGAQVKATGNILILGALKGVAHAGCKGETNAFVFAISLIPVQLRIANIITRFPDGDSKEDRKPEYAYVEDGKIYVSPFE